MNEIELTIRGNVGSDPEQVVFADGGYLVKFTVATSPRRPDREGNWVDGPTVWFTVTCRRGLAENVKASVRKGQPVVVQGRYQQGRWDQEGVPRQRSEIEARAVGHNLQWGTAAFTKVLRAESEEDGSPAPDQDAQAFASTASETGVPVTV